MKAKNSESKEIAELKSGKRKVHRSNSEPADCEDPYRNEKLEAMYTKKYV